MIIGALLIGALLLGLWFLLKAGPSEDPLKMVGLEGIAQETFSKEGMVFVRGELWRATAHHGLIVRGARVIVLGVEPGLLLIVEGAKDIRGE